MAKNFLDKIGLAHYHEKIKELIEGNGEGIQELTSPVRIWDLEDGVYQLPASSIIYYYGSSNTSNSFTVDSTSILFVSKQSSYKYYFIIGGSSLTNYLYYGYTISSSGTKYSLKMNDIKTPTTTLAQYNLGYYSTTSTITNLNSTNYVNPGIYGMSINAGTGIPNEITSGSQAILNVLVSKQKPSGATYIRQDLYVPGLNRHWKRTVYFNASSYTYPDWEEVVEDLEGNLKTINGVSLLGSGDMTIEAGGSEIPELSTSFYIWNLEPGIYKVPDGAYVYYKGTSTASSFSFPSSAYLYISVDSPTSVTRKYYFAFCGSSSTRYIYSGYSTSSDGAHKTFNIGSTYLTSISSYVKNNLLYSSSTTDYALSAYQGYLLDQNKQDKLVSGTNIKTINGGEVLGEGDISIPDASEKVAVTLTGVNSSSTYDCFYFPATGMAWFSMYSTGLTTTANSRTTIATVPEGYRPSRRTALATDELQDPTGNIKASINSSGEITLLTAAAKSSGDDQYISGWWYVG